MSNAPHICNLCAFVTSRNCVFIKPDSHRPQFGFLTTLPLWSQSSPMTNQSPATVLHTDTGCNPEADFSIKPRVINLVEVGTNQLYLAAIVLTAVVK